MISRSTGLSIFKLILSRNFSRTSQWRISLNKGINMATATRIYLTPEDVGITSFGKQSKEAAEKTSELLQLNHKSHHIFFNASGFHNHIVHGLLSLYGTNGPIPIIQQSYEQNASYQQPQPALEERIIEDMGDPEKFQKYLGKGEYYQDFLVFFQRRIGEVGWEKVVEETFFGGGERGGDMLVRLFASLIHPIIHLGFGIEFNQPAIIAEALAETAVHKNREKSWLLGAEKLAAANSTSPPSKHPTLIELLHEAKEHPKISTAAEWDDENKVEDGLLVRAHDETLNWLAKWSVDREGGEEELERRTVEMIQGAIYFTAGAMRADKKIKFDFFFLHTVTASIFWPTFNKLPFLTLDQKARLLEWKARTDLITYASRRCPEIRLSEVTNFIPKSPLPTIINLTTSSSPAPNSKASTFSPTSLWPQIITQIYNYKRDDGHFVKLLRALKYAETASLKYEEVGEPWVVIKSQGENGNMFEKIGQMVLESLPKADGPSTVRGAGFDEAWEGIPGRDEESVDGLAVKLEDLRA